MEKSYKLVMIADLCGNLKPFRRSIFAKFVSNASTSRKPLGLVLDWTC